MDTILWSILIVDKQRIISFANQATKDVWGYTKEELIGKEIEVLVPDSVRPEHPRLVQSYMVKPEIRTLGAGRDLFGRHKDGHLVPVEIALGPIEFENDIYVLCSVVDISVRWEIEKKMKEKTEELDQFAYRTSHDLKAPLSSLMGLAECIMEDIGNKDYREALKNASKFKFLISNLLHLLDNILALSRADLQDEEYEKFDFKEFISMAKMNFDFITKGHSIEMNFILGHNSDFITQRTRLWQVLENLISNAIKYCDKKKEKRYVSVYTSNDEKNFYIKVKDNGSGIPKNREKEIFGMFKRFHENSGQGSGLGLYMARKYITKLGGKISFESSPKGTTFSLSFPLAP